MFLVSQAISQNHVITWSYDGTGKGQLRQAITVPSFVAIDIAVMVLVCPVMSQDHINKRWSNIMARRPS